MPNNLKPCKFTFDDTPAFDGFSYGSKWNGFDNVAVTPEVREQIVSYFDGDAADISEIPVSNDGLVSLGWGFCTQIVETEPDHM